MQTDYLVRGTTIARLVCGLMLATAVFVTGPVSIAEGAEEAEEVAAGVTSAAPEAATDSPNDAATDIATEADAGGDDDAESPAPADSVGGQMGEVSLEKFIPTEEISADGAVSFPVDI